MSSGPIPRSAILHYHWGTQSYLWCTAYDRPRGRKSLCRLGINLVRLLFLFHDNCGFITRPDVLYFLHSLSTTWVAPQVSNLPDVAAGLGSTLHVVEDYVFDFVKLLTRICSGSHTTGASSIALIAWVLFHEGMLLHEKGIVTVL